MTELITITGLKEAIAEMRTVKGEIIPHIGLALEEAMAPMLDAVKTYPAIPTPTNPNSIYLRGQGTYYVPTGKLYATSQDYKDTSGFSVQAASDGTTGIVYTRATYSKYLRGDLNGYPGASIHINNWESLASIVGRLMPGAVDRLERSLGHWIEGLGKAQ